MTAFKKQDDHIDIKADKTPNDIDVIITDTLCCSFNSIQFNLILFRGMYLSLGEGNLLVRMLGSWEKVMVDHSISRRLFRQVKYSLASELLC